MTLPNLMRLSEAAEKCGLKVSSLRTEIRHGRLHPVVIAGRFYLTEAELGAMIERCRENRRGHGSISDADGPQDGSSSTDQQSVALDAASMSLQKLKEHSRRTSQKNISRDEQQGRSTRS